MRDVAGHTSPPHTYGRIGTCGFDSRDALTLTPPTHTQEILMEIIEQGISNATGHYITLYLTDDGRYLVVSQDDPRDMGESTYLEDEEEAEALFDNLMGH